MSTLRVRQDQEGHSDSDTVTLTVLQCDNVTVRECQGDTVSVPRSVTVWPGSSCNLPGDTAGVTAPLNTERAASNRGSGAGHCDTVTLLQVLQ